MLFAKRISSEIARRTYREFEKQGIVTPQSIIDTGWDKLVEALDSGGYVRYDFSTASNLLEMAASLVEKYGSLEALYSQSKDDRELEKRLLEFKGVDPTTVNIFLRELKAVWAKARPKLSSAQLAMLAMDSVTSLDVVEKVFGFNPVSLRQRISDILA